MVMNMMNRLSDAAIEIVNELHTERLDYNSEYIPLIDALNRLAAYEDTGFEPDDIKIIYGAAEEMRRNEEARIRLFYGKYRLNRRSDDA